MFCCGGNLMPIQKPLERRWSIAGALDPSGGGLKQIDPARTLPVHGIPV
jgi:hypothetical protein